MSEKLNQDAKHSPRRESEDDGWGPMRRVLRLGTGGLTIYAFYHGAVTPEHIFEPTNGPTLMMRLASGAVIAFLPLILFGLTFVRGWK